MLPISLKSHRIINLCGSWFACLIGYHGNLQIEGQLLEAIGKEDTIEWNLMMISNHLILPYQL